MNGYEGYFFEAVSQAADGIKYLRGLIGLGSIINLTLALIATVVVWRVRRSVRETVGGLRSDVQALGDSFTAISIKLTSLNEQMAATLEQVDKSVDTLTVRVERGKIELEQAVNEAFTRGSEVINTRGSVPIVANSNQNAPEDFEANWLEMKKIWDQTKSEVDYQLINVADKIRDGRRRRRYENLNKRNYENVIYRLLEDNWISGEAADALLEMNSFFNSRKNKKRAVTSIEMQDFRALQARWHANHSLANKAA